MTIAHQPPDLLGTSPADLLDDHLVEPSTVDEACQRAERIRAGLPVYAMRSAVRYLWADRWGRLAIMATITGLLFMAGVVTWVPMLYAIPELRTLRRAA